MKGKENEKGDVLAKLDRLKNEMRNALLKEDNTTVSSATKGKENFDLGIPNITKKQVINDFQPPKIKLSKIDEIRSKIVGFSTRYMSPFRIEMEAVYVDHTATNRPYTDVEDMISYAKLLAANPHTEFSHFGSNALFIQNIPRR